MFDIIEAAGWPVYFLLFASVIALALIIERLMTLRTKHVLPQTLLQEVMAVYQHGPVQKEMIVTLEQNSPLGRVLAAGLRYVDAPRDVMKEAIEEAGRRAAHELRRFLPTLGTIASLATLMGLLGTVVGMIDIFASQQTAGANPVELAHGISVALYNTALGILIAMPTIFFYRHFNALVEHFIVEMEHQAIKFVDMIHTNHQTPLL